MSYLRVFTCINRQLNAATSTPTASYPDSRHWTSVVPEPANGSSTRPPTPHVATEKCLDELRDELPEIWVKTVNVLRPLALRELLLRPREVKLVGESTVERGLRRSHAGSFDSAARVLPSGTRSTWRPRTAAASNTTSSPSSSGWVASQLPAAVNTRRTFSSSIISNGCPNADPLFSFTSTTTTRSPRRERDRARSAQPRVCLEQSVATEPVVTEGDSLAAVHAAS